MKQQMKTLALTVMLTLVVMTVAIGRDLKPPTSRCGKRRGPATPPASRRRSTGR